MGFRLKGGSPKNMNQSVYWVQRHREDQRRARAAARRAVQENDRYAALGERFERIQNNVQYYFLRASAERFNSSINEVERLIKVRSDYEEMVSKISDETEVASRDISRLAILARTYIHHVAIMKNDEFIYDAKTKKVCVANIILDFS